jgi:enterochelin esterase-like enzyme
VLLVRGRFSQFQPANNLLSHLDGTDVWFKTLKLPRGSRFQYTFSENDPQGTLPPGTGERRTVHDPFNPHHLPDNTTTPKDHWVSVVELPGAAPQPWYPTRSDVPTLRATRHHLTSTVLNSEREIVIYTPPGYRAKGPGYPTVYLFDGEDPDGLVFASSTVGNLIHDGKIPPLVVVRIVNPSQTVRQRELSCLPSFATFLANELVPFVRHTYHVSTDPERTGIGGYSLGGLAAAYSGFTHPETFGLVLAQSGSFWFEPTGTDEAEPNWLARQFVQAPKRPLRFYLEAGLFEVDLQGRGRGILETSRDLRNVLQAKGYGVDYHEFPGDHDYLNWRGTFADALIDLFGGSAK